MTFIWVVNPIFFFIHSQTLMKISSVFIAASPPDTKQAMSVVNIKCMLAKDTEMNRPQRQPTLLIPTDSGAPVPAE